MKTKPKTSPKRAHLLTKGERSRHTVAACDVLTAAKVPKGPSKLSARLVIEISRALDVAVYNERERCITNLMADAHERARRPLDIPEEYEDGTDLYPDWEWRRHL